MSVFIKTLLAIPLETVLAFKFLKCFIKNTRTFQSCFFVVLTVHVSTHTKHLWYVSWLYSRCGEHLATNGEKEAMQCVLLKVKCKCVLQLSFYSAK